MIHRRCLLGTMAAAAALPLARPAFGTGYPDRPIRLVVPFTPGGGADTLARMVVQPMAERLGQNIVVENRPGGGTTIGSGAIARSAPDGYSLLVGTGSLVINQYLLPTVPYDIVKDFAPIGLMARIPFVLVVNPQLPIRSVPELIAYAKANPGKLNFGSYGMGSPAHLTGELFAREAGIQIEHIAYSGTAPALVDLVAGRVGMMFSTILPAVPQINDGRLRALAVTSETRVPVLSSLPTMMEAGMQGFESTGWNGLLAPAGTPAPVIGRLSAELIRALEEPRLKQELNNQGHILPTSNTPDDLRKLLQAEAAKWSKTIREAKISVE
ncbi:Bug family tripartite tricarboxylate transporter substrate binding protein [Roseomonas xinghualingensis]|uniref:Bug family tripartite tricarboxylate transporter substrate binding protein n=1 Tax=Roseomonas xinghualingensis TaxID=2986475 RepID=UPI0021F1E305|nr:tripartite tricarboxylate transporter substrate binding protein [Roseomonas sp. SXEYE001]MCV4210123.1 tripartite tricarboxylate transporter substrate binding protein [Roseomonas sp. SXEYE001]